MWATAVQPLRCLRRGLSRVAAPAVLLCGGRRVRAPGRQARDGGVVGADHRAVEGVAEWVVGLRSTAKTPAARRGRNALRCASALPLKVCPPLDDRLSLSRTPRGRLTPQPRVARLPAVCWSAGHTVFEPKPHSSPHFACFDSALFCSTLSGVNRESRWALEPCCNLRIGGALARKACTPGQSSGWQWVQTMALVRPPLACNPCGGCLGSLAHWAWLNYPVAATCCWHWRCPRGRC